MSNPYLDHRPATQITNLSFGQCANHGPVSKLELADQMYVGLDAQQRQLDEKGFDAENGINSCNITQIPISQKGKIHPNLNSKLNIFSSFNGQSPLGSTKLDEQLV